MQTVTVGFSKPKSFSPYSWMIMKILGTPFSHVYLKIHSDLYSRDMIYQASSLMVNFMSPTIMSSKHQTVAEFPLQISDATMVKVMQYAIDNAGVPYGIMQALGMGYVQICSWFGRKVSNPWTNDGKTFVCSELVGDILIEVMGDNAKGVNMNDLDPKVIYDYLAH